MSKYNVGDKVSLAVENFRGIPKGTVGIVTNVEPDRAGGAWPLDIDFGPAYARGVDGEYIADEEVELVVEAQTDEQEVKFAVGDTVRAKEDCFGDVVEGQTYEVLKSDDGIGIDVVKIGNWHPYGQFELVAAASEREVYPGLTIEAEEPTAEPGTNGEGYLSEISKAKTKEHEVGDWVTTDARTSWLTESDDPTVAQVSAVFAPGEGESDIYYTYALDGVDAQFYGDEIKKVESPKQTGSGLDKIFADAEKVPESVDYEALKQAYIDLNTIHYALTMTALTVSIDGRDTSAKELTDLLANGVALKLDEALQKIEQAVPSFTEIKVETVNPEND